jgi:hypothetical protein
MKIRYKKSQDQEKALELCKTDAELAGAIKFFRHIGFKPVVYENARARFRSESFFIEFSPIVPYFENSYETFENRYERHPVGNQFSLSIYFYTIRYGKWVNLALMDKHGKSVCDVRPSVLTNATITVVSNGRYKYEYSELKLNPEHELTFAEFKNKDYVRDMEEVSTDVFNGNVFNWLIMNNGIKIEVIK